MERVRNVVGTPVRGDDLWDREKEIEDIWKALERSNVLLAAARRFGKTSLMLNLMDNPRSGYKVFYLDVEWVKGPDDFIAELIAKLLEDRSMLKIFQGVRSLLGRVINRIEEIGFAEFKVGIREELTGDWQGKGKEFIARLKDAEGKIVIIVDEFPLLVHKMLAKDKDNAEGFLYWFRGVRQMPELLDKVRFVIGGSIGIEKVLQMTGAGPKSINDLRRIQLEPFSEEVAFDFIRLLLKNDAGMERVPPDVLNKFRETVEVYIPYFIQILVSESIREAERQRSPLSPEIIEKAYFEGVLSAYNRTYFEHYYTRLHDYYQHQEEAIAKAFLLEVAKRGQVPKADLWNLYHNLTRGAGSEQDFSYILSSLENDFYITSDSKGNVYRFATKVLRDWWLRHYTILD